ncbi:RNA polymerase sigma factor [Sporocytophaga myxococcoides]|uniref:RNA polymerase sigma factor n=1 Tax=Sporocytophaga myxococcoides TaxID=153721 RepID=UPI000409CCD2|nr:sigma-70 family RNA polymerase sigma factor [Sporocytophaga myxococcoides]
MLKEADIIKGCKEYNSVAQNALYKTYAPKMKALCVRYSSNEEEAKDLMQEGFIKVFSNIKSYNGKGSFEGWIKRIMINTAISHYKKNKNKFAVEDISLMNSKEVGSEQEEEVEEIYSEYTSEDLMKALNSLPEQYKLVFNLFCIENHSHTDIAQLLSLDEKTSRTRLFRAKKMLKDYLINLSGKRWVNSSER